MILTIFLWFQVFLLAILGFNGVYLSAKQDHHAGRIATASAITFSFFIVVSSWAALAVGGAV